MKQPCVYLVGAGPGDPELLTMRAFRLIQEADAVVYDRLVSEAILALIPHGATRIYVGKRDGRHLVPQQEINDILLGLARAGRSVVRLKGGDPFVFGRGSEEAEYLATHGFGCEVVPGISAAVGCTAAAGIPLTHRGLATGVRFVTGHFREGAEFAPNWASLADPDTTLVIYMGLGNAEAISRNLIAAGLAPGTPAAAIENGTTVEERICVTTLDGLSAMLEVECFKPPTLLVVGKVVELARVLKPEASVYESAPKVALHG